MILFKYLNHENDVFTSLLQQVGTIFILPIVNEESVKTGKENAVFSF